MSSRGLAANYSWILNFVDSTCWDKMAMMCVFPVFEAVQSTVLFTVCWLADHTVPGPTPWAGRHLASPQDVRFSCYRFWHHTITGEIKHSQNLQGGLCPTFICTPVAARYKLPRAHFIISLVLCLLVHHQHINNPIPCSIKPWATGTPYPTYLW